MDADDIGGLMSSQIDGMMREMMDLPHDATPSEPRTLTAATIRVLAEDADVLYSDKPLEGVDPYKLVRVFARTVARENGHELGEWRTLSYGPKTATCTRCLAGVIYDPTEDKGIMLLHLEEPCGAADRRLHDMVFAPK